MWEWAQTALVAGNLAWTTLCLGGFLAETMMITSALNGLLLAVHLAARTAGGVGRAHPAGKWLLPFLFYALANVYWVSPVRWLGWRDWLGWAQMILVFWVVLNGVRAPSARTALILFMMGLGVTVVVLECYQRFVHPDWLMLGRTQADQYLHRSSGPFGIPNSAGAFLILLLPATIALTVRRGARAVQRLAFGYLVLLFSFGLVLTVSRGAWLGLAIALAAWPLFASRRHWLWRLAGGVVIAGVLVAAAAGLRSTVPMVAERFEAFVRDSGEHARPIIWRAAWRIFQEHPVWGGGAAGFDPLFEKYRPDRFLDQPVWAHNDYLNTLCDYGAVGFALFFGVCALIMCKSWRRPASDEKPRRREFDGSLVVQGLAAGLLAFALQLLVEFNLKIPALAMSAAIVAALVVQRRWFVSENLSPPGAAGRCIGGAMIAAVAAAICLFVLPRYHAEALRESMRWEIDHTARNPVPKTQERALLVRARAQFARATELDPDNAQAWADRAYATALWSRHEEGKNLMLGAESEGYARRAVSLSTVVPEFWMRLGVSLDMQGHWVDAEEPFIRALTLAPSNPLTWYYHAYHLAFNPQEKGLAEAAVAICLRLDPGNREAEALRRRLANSR